MSTNAWRRQRWRNPEGAIGARRSKEVLEGSWTPHRLVILEFESLAQAKAWVNSEEYRPARISVNGRLAPKWSSSRALSRPESSGPPMAIQRHTGRQPSPDDAGGGAVLVCSSGRDNRRSGGYATARLRHSPASGGDAAHCLTLVLAKDCSPVSCRRRLIAVQYPCCELPVARPGRQQGATHARPGCRSLPQDTRPAARGGIR